MSETVFINGRFLSQRLSGVQRYAREVLAALDHRVSCGEESDSIRYVVLAPPNAEAPQLQSIEFRKGGRLKGNAWEQLELPVLTGNSLLLSFSATGPLVKKRQLLTVHDASVYAVPQAYGKAFRAWYRLQLQYFLPRLPFTLTVSDFSRRELAKYVGCDVERFRVVTEGWQHILRAPADTGILDANELSRERYVLAVSNVTPNKNFGLVIDAMKRLKRPAFKVAIAGAIDERVFGSVDTEELPFVKRLGYVSDGELRALYENAAVFVYPSLYEGFGIPPLEAMALGCPVVASSSSVLPETCGDAAEFISPDDADGLAQIVTRLVDNPTERAMLAERGRAWVQRYSWDAAAHLTAKYVREALSVNANSWPRRGPRVLSAFR